MAETKTAVHSPFDEHLIAELPVTKEPAALAALQLATETFADRDKWLPVEERKQILEKFLQILTERKAEFGIRPQDAGLFQTGDRLSRRESIGHAGNLRPDGKEAKRTVGRTTPESRSRAGARARSESLSV